MQTLKTLKKMVTLLSIVFLFSEVCFGNVPRDIASDVRYLINQTDPYVYAGVVIQDVTTGKILYQRNAHQNFVPASNEKLYSAATALMVLGPHYRFQTPLYTDAKEVHPGTLMGNLYLQFSGDPTLKSTDLEHLIQEIKKLSIHAIAGNVILLPANYTLQGYGPGWSERDRELAYGAPVSPTIIDENKILVRASVLNHSNRASVQVFDPSKTVHVTNNVRTVYNRRLGAVRFELNWQNDLNASGYITPRYAAGEALALKNPMNYAQGVVIEALKKEGISFKGKVMTGARPKTFKLLATHTSAPLSEILTLTLKTSNNLYANSLFLKAAEVYLNGQASWQNAGFTVKKVLSQYAGLDLNQAVFMDGSGLSRDNRVTPWQTVHLLRSIHQQFPIRYEFITALPIAGKDGTLKRRMPSLARDSRVRAKTGTMQGVVSLAGYLTTANNHTLVFAFMFNAIPKRAFYSWKYRALEDRLCEYLAKQSVA